VIAGEDSDTPILSGPELDVVLLQDVASWLPESTSLHLLGRALFGKMELFDIDTDVQLYAIAAGLGVPIIDAGSFRLEGSLSAGPGFLKTDMGDAVGLSGATGLRVRQELTSNLSLFGVAEIEIFRAKQTSALGPAFNFGFNLAW
jgi:hypothetical protein